MNNCVEARKIWYALFNSGSPLLLKDWSEWADNQILKCSDAPSEWLCSLALAKTYEQATSAVSDNIGIELPKQSELNMQDLLVGFIVCRHLSGELTFDEMWAMLYAKADIAEFLDAGNWRHYCNSRAEEIIGNTQAALLQQLVPVAEFAKLQGAKLHA